MNFLQTTEQLKQYLKVYSSLPEDIFQPYRQGAIDTYLIKYLGERLIDQLDEYAGLNNQDNTILSKALTRFEEALACFTMYLATDETSVNVSDSGITVTRNELYAAANDTKITAYKNNLLERGYQSLYNLLSYLFSKRDEFNQWITSKYFKLSHANLMNNCSDFSSFGLVELNSNLLFDRIRPTLSLVEQDDLIPIIGEENYNKLLNSIRNNVELDSLYTVLFRHANIFTAHKTVYNFTLNNNLSAHFLNKNTDYYSLKAEQYKKHLINYINKYHSEFGFAEPIFQPIKFNDENKGTFIFN